MSAFFELKAQIEAEERDLQRRKDALKVLCPEDYQKHYGAAPVQVVEPTITDEHNAETDLMSVIVSYAGVNPEMRPRVIGKFIRRLCGSEKPSAVLHRIRNRNIGGYRLRYIPNTRHGRNGSYSLEKV